ncbi:MAG: hypothetical protein KUG77_04385 [Nannocystaceae bacterium]|nr:hypothetical protein [Nannocystaceae bacterium]
MRAVGQSLAALLVLSAAVGPLGCDKSGDDEPAWRKPPERFDVKGDGLTFGSKNLDAFNTMAGGERAAHVDALKSKPGSYKGQGRFQVVSELGENLADHAVGKYDASVTVDDPVLYEITIEYNLLSNEKIGDGYPKGTYVEFTGTLVDLDFQDDSKPRKLVIKLKDTKFERLDA